MNTYDEKISEIELNIRLRPVYDYVDAFELFKHYRDGMELSGPTANGVRRLRQCADLMGRALDAQIRKFEENLQEEQR